MGADARLKEAGARLLVTPRNGRRWYVNAQGQAFVIIEEKATFRIGSPPTEPDRDLYEVPSRRVIPRRFAISAHEVTVKQFQQFVEENRGKWNFSVPEGDLAKFSPDPDGPIVAVNWFTAAAYCNWLSEKEGILRSEWCYELPEEGLAGGIIIPADSLRRTGYRLPTEEEWEYACRAGTVTSRYFGHSAHLLGKYAWYSDNSDYKARPCGLTIPNDLGLFDVLGNVEEWCGDPYDVRSEDHRTLHQREEYISINSDATVTVRNVRGAGFKDFPANVRSAYRFSRFPTQAIGSYGIRPARTCPP